MSPFRHGFLLVDKPVGPTSHDVVQAARRAIKERRIGHTGTLDPAATGLLLLCIGKATRLQQYLLAWEKTYHGEIRLGWGTTTYDAEGEPLAPPRPVPDLDAARSGGPFDPLRGRAPAAPAPLLGQEDRGTQVLRARPRRRGGPARAQARAGAEDRARVRRRRPAGLPGDVLVRHLPALARPRHRGDPRLRRAPGLAAARPDRPVERRGRGQRRGAGQPPARDRPAGRSSRSPRPSCRSPRWCSTPRPWSTLPTARRWSCARRRAASYRGHRWRCGTGAASSSASGWRSPTWRGHGP